MFQGYSNETIEFFLAIRFNNNRPFFLENRDWYLRAVRECCHRSLHPVTMCKKTICPVIIN